MNLYKFAPDYAGHVQSDLSFYVSVTASTNSTECAGECASSVKDQSQMTGSGLVCGTDYKLNLTNKNYDIQISSGYDNETLAYAHYTQLHRIWLQNYLYHYG